jgi:hypothetical protein
MLNNPFVPVELSTDKSLVAAEPDAQTTGPAKSRGR